MPWLSRGGPDPVKPTLAVTHRPHVWMVDVATHRISRRVCPACLLISEALDGVPHEFVILE